MDNNKLIKNVKEYIKKTSVSNLITIALFFIALLLFIFLAIKSGINHLLHPENDEAVKIYIENLDNYDITRSDEYKVSLVTSYSTFFNTQDILDSIFNSIKNDNIADVYDLLSKNYLDILNSDKDNICSRISSFYNNNFQNSNSVFLDELYNIPDSNYYIAYVLNDAGEDVKIVLNIDNQNLVYKIEYIENL